jgi:hypothetical protein
MGPLLAGGGVVQMLAEPAVRALAQTFFGVVGLPAGKAGLRRRCAAG